MTEQTLVEIKTRNGSNTIVTVTRDDHGFWLYITDDESEQSVWLTPEQMQQIGSASQPLSEAGTDTAQERSAK